MLQYFFFNKKNEEMMLKERQVVIKHTCNRIETVHIGIYICESFRCESFYFFPCKLRNKKKTGRNKVLKHVG